MAAVGPHVHVATMWGFLKRVGQGPRPRRQCGLFAVHLQGATATRACDRNVVVGRRYWVRGGIRSNDSIPAWVVAASPVQAAPRAGLLSTVRSGAGLRETEGRCLLFFTARPHHRLAPVRWRSPDRGGASSWGRCPPPPFASGSDPKAETRRGSGSRSGGA